MVVCGVKEKWGKELKNGVGRWGCRALWESTKKRKKFGEN